MPTIRQRVRVERDTAGGCSFFRSPPSKTSRPVTDDGDGETKRHKKKRAPFAALAFLFFCVADYFTLSTIALKASGLFMARSARTLRLISIPALCRAPINWL